MKISVIRMANIRRHAQFENWHEGQWIKCGVGIYAKIEDYCMLWSEWGVMEEVLSAKAVASTRLRTLIFT